MDDPLSGMQSMVESVSQYAENSPMVKSIVQYVAPEKTFRETYPFEDRYVEASRIMEKYPDRIPVICEHGQRGNNPLPHDPKKKFLIPKDMTVGQFVYVIRKRIQLPPEQAVFLFIVAQNRDGSLNNVLAPTSHMFDTVYAQYKDRDRFLYFVAQNENVFGNNYSRTRPRRATTPISTSPSSVWSLPPELSSLTGNSLMTTSRSGS